MSNKVAIIGVRNPNISYENWKKKYQDLILSYSPEFIVSGGAKGIDAYAAQLSKDLNIPLLEFKPDYKTYGKNAPLVRNELIVKNSDVIIATKDLDGNELRPDKIKAVTMQAVGQVVGVPLSDDENSIMFKESDFTKSSVTQDAVKSVWRLYKPSYR